MSMSMSVLLADGAATDHLVAVGPVVGAGVAADLRTLDVVLAYGRQRGTRFQLSLSC